MIHIQGKLFNKDSPDSLFQLLTAEKRSRELRELNRGPETHPHKKHHSQDGSGTPSSPKSSNQQEHTGHMTSHKGNKGEGIFGASLYKQVAVDMVDIMKEHGPDIFGFESIPPTPKSVSGELGFKIVDVGNEDYDDEECASRDS